MHGNRKKGLFLEAGWNRRGDLSEIEKRDKENEKGEVKTPRHREMEFTEINISRKKLKPYKCPSRFSV